MPADPNRVRDGFPHRVEQRRGDPANTRPDDADLRAEVDPVLFALADPTSLGEPSPPKSSDAAGAFRTEKSLADADAEIAGDSRHPPGVELLVHRKRRRMRWALAVGLILGPGLAAALTPFGGSAAIIGWIAGGIASFFGLLVAFAFWTDDRRVLGRLAAFRRGDHLARWTYTPEEWQAHDETWTPASPVGQAFIGRDCALCGGTFIEWNVLGCSLEKVIFVIGPPVLIQFILYHYDSNGAQWRDSLGIPVPAGKEAEAHSAIEAIVRGHRKSYLAMVIYGLLALVAVLLIALKLALWAGVIK